MNTLYLQLYNEIHKAQKIAEELMDTYDYMEASQELTTKDVKDKEMITNMYLMLSMFKSDLKENADRT